MSDVISTQLRMHVLKKKNGWMEGEQKKKKLPMALACGGGERKRCERQKDVRHAPSPGPLFPAVL